MGGSKKKKQRYRDFCQEELTLPIFQQAWWLDATAGDEWDVALVETSGVVMASMPYVSSLRWGFRVIGQPGLTQFLGPWIRPSEAKYAKALAQQKDLMDDLISQLPRFSYFSQNWSPLVQNWLPFFWNGFRQTTKYTYVLPDLSDLELVWDGFRENIRGDIRKAESRFSLTVVADESVERFLTLNQKVFERQGIRNPYDEKFVRNVDDACVRQGSRKILIAVDSEGRIHAGVYLVWDQNCVYYLMGGGDPELRNSGATSLCLWEAIKFASANSKKFDFEGSMIEPVERFVRGFGAVQMPYHSLSKTPSKLLKIYKFLLDLRGK